MKLIKFICEATLKITSQEIAGQILDLEKWSEFEGYGPMPGIKSAEFEVRTPDVVGTRIRVTNRDGSRHVEEIVQWQPENRIQLRMCEFRLPLSALATSIIETWDFSREGNLTRVTRTFEMNPTSVAIEMLLSLK